MLLHCMAFGGLRVKHDAFVCNTRERIGMDTEERQIESYREISIFDLRSYEPL